MGGLTFAAPLALAALAVLPLVWWLLRVTPPAPRRQPFPAVRLLMGLIGRQQQTARTPWWMLLLRLLAAALVIVGLAQPLIGERRTLPGTGPVVLVMDDGWAAAADWEKRRSAALALVDEADRTGRPVALATTAPPADGGALMPVGPMPAAGVRSLLQGLTPKPWASRRATVLSALLGDAPGTTAPGQSQGLVHHQPGKTLRARLTGQEAQVVWFSDGLADDGAEADFAARMQVLGGLTVVADPAGPPARLVLPPDPGAGVVSVVVRRADTGPGTGAMPAELAWVRALDEAGVVLARQTVSFAEGRSEARVRLDLPTELRNRIQRLDLEGVASAGAVALVDGRWQRRPVGLVSGAPLTSGVPLVSDLYYLKRALGPLADVREGGVSELLARELSVLVLADVGRLPEEDTDAVEAWIRAGGVLVRFAGPATAAGADPLLPVRLRAGERATGGALTWDRPLALAPFAERTPFAGLEVPDDVRVFTQVLAEPAPDLGGKTWARLADGTPLVTGEAHGQGWAVLVHTTANARWSNLALSGLFVDMLERLMALGAGVGDEGAGAGAAGADAPPPSLPPIAVFDGFGRLVAPTGAVRPLPSRLPAAGSGTGAAAGDAPPARIVPGPQHPPGLYGAGRVRQGLNLGPAVAPPKALPTPPADARVLGFADIGRLVDLRSWLLAGALLLLIVDLGVSLVLRGAFARRRPGEGGSPAGGPSAAAGTALVALLALLALAGGTVLAVGPAAAQAPGPGGPTVLDLPTLTLPSRPMGPGGEGGGGVAPVGAGGVAPVGAGGVAPVRQRTGPDAFALEAALDTRLAFVRSGDAEVDDLSRRGLSSLTGVLAARTAVAMGDPMAVDIESDPLLFFPLLYWPVTPVQAALSPTAAAKVEAYMRHGGVILFDTRDAGDFPGGGGGNGPQTLRTLLAEVNVPPLVPLDHEHVLTRSFYLLRDLPGRVAGGVVWAARNPDVNDGVSPVIIGGNDWAGAWAAGPGGRPLLPVIPGGERQRELALRFGVNLVMYALTGNYKADQVHLPAILERLTQ